MGKRVCVERLAMGASTGPGGEVVLHPYEQYATLSCGHHGGRVSFASFSGEPAWCEKCEGACLACGEPATACHTPSLEWGEACAACVDVDDAEWCSRVKSRRLEVMPIDEHVRLAAHYAKFARTYEHESLDPEHEFWPGPPLHLSRRVHAQNSLLFHARAMMHLLFVLRGDTR